MAPAGKANEVWQDSGETLLLGQRGLTKDRLEGQLSEHATASRLSKAWRIILAKGSDTVSEYPVYLEPIYCWRGGDRL